MSVFLQCYRGMKAIRSAVDAARMHAHRCSSVVLYKGSPASLQPWLASLQPALDRSQLQLPKLDLPAAHQIFGAGISSECVAQGKNTLVSYHIRSMLPQTAQPHPSFSWRYAPLHSNVVQTYSTVHLPQRSCAQLNSFHILESVLQQQQLVQNNSHPLHTIPTNVSSTSSSLHRSLGAYALPAQQVEVEEEQGLMETRRPGIFEEVEAGDLPMRGAAEVEERREANSLGRNPSSELCSSTVDSQSALRSCGPPQPSSLVTEKAPQHDFQKIQKAGSTVSQKVAGLGKGHKPQSLWVHRRESNSKWEQAPQIEIQKHPKLGSTPQQAATFGKQHKRPSLWAHRRDSKSKWEQGAANVKAISAVLERVAHSLNLDNGRREGRGFVEEVARLIQEEWEKGLLGGNAAAHFEGQGTVQGTVKGTVEGTVRGKGTGVPRTAPGAVPVTVARSAGGPSPPSLVLPFDVNDVLKHQRDPTLSQALVFWAEKYQGVTPTLHLLTTLVSILGKSKDRVGVEGVVKRMGREGVELDDLARSRVGAAFKNVGMNTEAFEVMGSRQMGPKALCTRLGLHNRCKQYRRCWRLFNQSWLKGVELDEPTYRTALIAVGRLGMRNEVVKLYRKMVKKFIEVDTRTLNILLDLYIKLGDHTAAESLFKEMKSKTGPKGNPNLFTYSIMLNMLGGQGKFKEAEALFQDMETRRLEPDEAVWHTMIKMHSDAGDLAGTKKWFRNKLRRGLSLDQPCCCLLLTVFVKGGRREEAERLAQVMVGKGMLPLVEVVKGQEGTKQKRRRVHYSEIR